MENLKEYNSGKQSNLGYKITIAVLGILLIGVVVLFFMQQRKTEIVYVELTNANEEKTALTLEYEQLLKDYEDIQSNNDSINAQLTHEKERIETLVAQLKTTKVQNKAEIEKYKRELQTLRDIMKGFVHQIDSLNTLNIELTAENKEIKNQYVKEQKKNQQLEEKYVDATDKVKLASVIKAVDVSMESFNEKGKATTRAKKTKRFAVKFSLDENVIAPRGTKDVYLRITNPEEHILIQNNQPVFSYEGEQIAYSSVRQVEYEGNLTPAVVYFENNAAEELVEGIYSVDVFCDGSMIGSAKMELK